MTSILLFLAAAVAVDEPAPSRPPSPAAVSARRVPPSRPVPPWPPPTWVPRVPKGMAACLEPLRPAALPTPAVGETLRYLLDVDGLSVGTIDFKVERRGPHEGRQVTEYRSLFQLDALVAAFVPVRGRAASLVPESGYWPIKAMNRYDLRADHFDEEVYSDPDGKQLSSVRLKNGEKRESKRRFVAPVLDFISAFYLLRVMPAEMRGCVIIYGNQRAYTVWVEPDGEERVPTPVGKRDAHRYRIQYASEKSRAPVQGRLWLSQDAARVPYRAELNGPQTLVGRIHVYETGTP